MTAADTELLIESLVALARERNLSVDVVANRLDIHPDRLHTRSMTEVIRLALQDDEQDWIRHQLDPNDESDLVEIEVCQRAGGGYHAQVKGLPGIWAAGDTRVAAIGDLIQSHADRFDIKIHHLEGKRR